MEGEPQPREHHEPEADQTAEHTTQHENEPVIPRIYVASLSDYNAGRLHGAWLDAAQEPDELHEGIARMLASSPERHAGEWAIHDFEGFSGLRLGEWENLEHVSQVAKGITEHGLAFAHWTTLVASDDELHHFTDAYQGHWRNLTAYAADYLDSIGLDQTLDHAVPDSLRSYVVIDSAAFGRDLEVGGDITAVEGEGGVYVFGNSW